MKTTPTFRKWIDSYRNALMVSVGIAAVLAAGFSMMASHAATAAIAVEPEDGALSGAVALSDASASGGKAITFTAAAGSAAGLPISRGVQAYGSSGTASQADDASYGTSWKSSGSSAWLAYDLSKASAADRNSVLLAWYNDSTWAYDTRLDASSGDPADMNFPKNYTIETNTAAGGGTAPGSGWTVKATVSSNNFHSRQHLVDMSGANWIRINISASAGSLNNLNMDVYPGSATQNSWIFYGSSTPTEAMSHLSLGSFTQTFSQIINAANPGVFPAQEDGSVSGLSTIEGAQNINAWLSVFPGKYVTIGLGANDAMDCVSATSFYNNFVTMVTAINKAGKVAIVPTMNWSPMADACGPGLISKLNQLYTSYSYVMKGPDFWTYYKNNPGLVSSDQTHPTTQGMADFRKLWAQWALANIYK